MSLTFNKIEIVMAFNWIILLLLLLLLLLLFNLGVLSDGPCFFLYKIAKYQLSNNLYISYLSLLSVLIGLAFCAACNIYNSICEGCYTLNLDDLP